MIKYLFFTTFLNFILAVQSNSQTDSVFYAAQNNLIAMLLLPKIEFKQAVFEVENTFHDKKLSYDNYNHEINLLVKLSKLSFQFNDILYDKEDKIKVKIYASIFKTLTDTTRIEVMKDSVTHYDHLPLGRGFHFSHPTNQQQRTAVLASVS